MSAFHQQAKAKTRDQIELSQSGSESQRRSRHRAPAFARRSAAAALPITCLLLFASSGCTTVSTQYATLQSGAEVNGMLYYLPIGKMSVSGSFEDVTLPADQPSIQASPSPAGTGKKVTQVKITVTAEVEADGSAGPFYAVPHRNYLFEDEVDVKVGKTHLLETGNVKSEDKSIAIVEQMTSIVSQALTANTASTAVNRLPFDFTFHPSDPDEYKEVKRKLHDRGITFTVSSSDGGHDKAVVLDRGEANRISQNGLLFRPAIPYTVRVQFPEMVDRTQQFLLPDPRHLYSIDYPRISFVKHEKNIGFTDGMLTEFHETTPSPILGFLGVPKAIIKGILPVGGG